MDSIHLRIRIDRAIAEQAMKMAQTRGMELADVIRMMVTKAVQIGDFSIEPERSKQQAVKAARPYYAYDERQWTSSKTVLDAELALALVDQYIASHTLQIETMMDRVDPDALLIEQLTQERDDARKVLATLDPTDADAVRILLEEFGPPPEPPESFEPNGSDDGRQW
jgi:antitoxin component of RelBE/YafQ-DinJ toxin-antitoxin module